MTLKPWVVVAFVSVSWALVESTHARAEEPLGGQVAGTIDGAIDDTVDPEVDRRADQTVDRRVDRTVDRRVDRTVDRRVDRTVDRIVAVVDGDPIFHSDLRRAVGLGLVERQVVDRDRKVVDLLIEQKLRSHESDRHQTRPITAAEIEAQVEGLASRFGGERQLLAEARDVGLDRSGLRRWIRHQLKVLRYVEERLAGRVFIDEQEIASYYEEQYCPNHPVPEHCPPVGEVRDEIEALLRSVGLNREIEVWTEELRLKARIVDLLDRAEDTLPPVVMREEMPGQENEKNQ